MKKFGFFLAAVFASLFAAQNANAYGVIGVSATGASGEVTVLVHAATNRISYAEAEQAYLDMCMNGLAAAGVMMSAIDGLCNLESSRSEGRLIRIQNTIAVGIHYNTPLSDITSGSTGRVTLLSTEAFTGELMFVLMNANGNPSAVDRTQLGNLLCSNAGVPRSRLNECVFTWAEDTTSCPGDLEPGSVACQCPTGERLNTETTNNAHDCIIDCTGTAGEAPNSGATACEACPAGQTPNTHVTRCERCPAGNVKASGATSCTACTGVNRANDAQTACEACPEHMIPNGDNSDCVPCDAGQVRYAADSACRAATSDTDCGNLNTGDVFEGGSCQTPQTCGPTQTRADDRISCKCADNFVADGQNCRAAERDDCPADDVIPHQPSDGMPNCTACTDLPGLLHKENPDGISCRPLMASDCDDGTLFDGGAFACLPQVKGDCPTDGEIPRATGGQKNCTTCVSINPNAPVEDTDGLSCRAFMPSDCAAADGEIVDGRYPTVLNNMFVCQTCSGVMVENAVGDGCRAATDDDDCPIDGENGEIPQPQNGLPNCTTCESLDSTRPFEDPDTGVCREMRPTDCPAAMPFFDSTRGNNGECRVRRATDCAPGEVFDAGTGGGTCRPQRASDCSTSGNNIDGEVPDAMQGAANCTACSGTTIIEDADGLRCRAPESDADCDMRNSGDLLVGGSCQTPQQCGPNQTRADDRISCNCAAGFVADGQNCRAPASDTDCDMLNPGDVFAGGRCQTPQTCGPTQTRAADKISCDCADTFVAEGANCVCPADRPEIYNTQSGAVCGKSSAELQGGVYSAADCTRAGWPAETAADAAGNIRRTCQIPVAITASAPQVSPAALSPLQTNVGDTPDACVLAMHNGFVGAGSFPNCEHENLFGASGLALPAMPPGFNAAAGDRLTIVAATGDAPREIYFNNALISRAFGGGNNADSAFGAGAVVGVALVGILLYGGDLSIITDYGKTFRFSPHAEFSHFNGFQRYSYGSRLDFNLDNWNVYWGASQKSGDSSWLYSTGAEYAEDFWRAGYTGVNYEDETNYDFNVSAHWRAGAWNWQSGINADVLINADGEDASAYWNAGAAMEYSGWRINPSANVYWREGGFGEGASFRINLRRAF